MISKHLLAILLAAVALAACTAKERDCSPNQAKLDDGCYNHWEAALVPSAVDQIVDVCSTRFGKCKTIEVDHQERQSVWSLRITEPGGWFKLEDKVSLELRFFEDGALKKAKGFEESEYVKRRCLGASRAGKDGATGHALAKAECESSTDCEKMPEQLELMLGELGCPKS